MIGSNPERPVSPLARRVTHLAIGLAVAAAMAVTFSLGTWHGAMPAPGGDMMQVAPGGDIELADVPEATQVHYRNAHADPDGHQAVRCWCGCEAMLDHRSLYDCFVRPDGGWERHAMGCGVCIAEAIQVTAARSVGTPLDVIAEQVDDRFGAIAPSETTS